MLSRTKTFVLQSIYFVRHSKQESARHANGQKLLPMLREFWRWRRSLGRWPMDEGLPWMSYSAIEFLQGALQKDWSVFEWGVGGSTVYLLSRVHTLASVEHETEWADSVRERLDAQMHSSWELMVIPPTPVSRDEVPDPSNPREYASAIDQFRNASFQTYASAIDRFGDAQFDLVIVDGRCRPSCAMHAIPKIRPGGFLLVDDCERDRYRWIHDEMKRRKWTFRYLNGPGPFVWEFRHTGCWQRPHAEGDAA